jgi:hypothetical protein
MRQFELHLEHDHVILIWPQPDSGLQPPPKPLALRFDVEDAPMLAALVSCIDSLLERERRELLSQAGILPCETPDFTCRIERGQHQS